MFKQIILAFLALTSVGAEIMTVTAYCPCVKCCGQWAKYKKTANGQTPRAGLTCAAPRALPFDTVLEIKGVGKRVVQDRLAVRFDSRIDLFFNTHSEALAFGKRRLNVMVSK